ncbi:MAG: efflux RND transporter periplasmic adaptor subunit, partial [Candidatus Hydrogenedentes bacterium]|nr:efflux RND transporter periplasmic adaptor subunit [Candidatus Hydrogenedentota bacterium]
MATSSRVGELLRGVAKWAGAKVLSLFLILAAVAIGFGLRGILAPPTQVAPAGSGAVQPTVAKAEVWTCSMHPQIQLPKPGLCPICNMTLIPLSSDDDGGMSGPRTFTTSEAAKGLMGIQTSEAIHRFVEKEVRMVGKVTFDETKLAYISSWIPGRIDKLYVDYTGVEVRKGDHMVYLYSPEILTTQDELRRAAYAVKKMDPKAPYILK